MRSVQKILIALIFALFVSKITYAACALIPCGWYLEGNVGHVSLSNSNFGSGSNTSTNKIGVNINWGYKASPFFAGEIGYTHYSNITVKNFLGDTAATIKNYAFDVAGKGILPICDTGVELFAKLGYAWVRTNTSLANSFDASLVPGLSSSSNRTNSGLYIGAGADYALTSQIPINIQWSRTRINNNVGNLDLISIGIAYIFG